MTIRSIGLDFGTTNSVAGTLMESGAVETITYDRNDGGEGAGGTDSPESIFPTLLTFWQEESTARTATKVEGGQWAIDIFREFAPDCRFIKSIKTFAANPGFSSTQIFQTRYGFADLMGAFLGRMESHGSANWQGKPVIMGRPIRFAGLRADADLAMMRYREALGGLGFEDIKMVYEPLAAAYYFVRSLQGEATIFVGDLGGGTSDFSVLKVKRQGGPIDFTPLASRGLGLAGDQFDYRIIQNTLAPLLGKGSKFRSFDKVLDVPISYYSNLASWHELSLLRGSKFYRDLVALKRDSLSPELIDRFIRFIESERLHDLYVTISDVKSRLSADETARFSMRLGAEDISSDVTRQDFESWIATDLDKLDGLITETLDDARLAASDVDIVFLTGGTSFVPAIQNLFAHRFQRAEVESGEQLVSVANGLALIAGDDNLDQWLA